MTQIKYGQLISDARGSTAGMTFTRNRTGSVMRTKKMGVRPNSQSQNDVKVFLSKSASAWKLLVPSHVKEWNLYAAGMSQKNRLGDNTKMTGFNYFCKIAAMRLRAGLDIEPSYRPIFKGNIFTDFEFLRNNVGNAMSIRANSVPAQTVYLTVASSPLVPLTQTLKKHDLRIISQIEITTDNTQVITSGYEEIFGQYRMNQPGDGLKQILLMHWMWDIVDGTGNGVEWCVEAFER
jgi:hypothetical protein